MRAPDPDRITLARIAGAVRNYAARGTITDAMRAQAVAELRAVSEDRGDLLAEHAGICLGFALAEGEPRAAIRKLEAELCILAGADRDLIPAWQETGWQRACVAMLPPNTATRAKRG